MKTLKTLLSIIAVGIFFITACTKTDTQTVTVTKSATDGQAKVYGTVKFYDQQSSTAKAAPGAIVQVAPDSINKAYFQFWATDANGNFSIKGLAVGNYYLNAVYTDNFGYKYFTNGFSISVNNSLDSIPLNFVCR